MNKEERRKAILKMMGTIPIVSTDQVAKFFPGIGSPQKRASEILKMLEQEKMIEGERRRIGETKVWRLAKYGREHLGVANKATPFNTPKIKHILGMGNVWQKLWFAGGLMIFDLEPKEEYKSAGRTKRYCPDAFIGFRKKAYLLELQLTPLSKSQWESKWKVVNEYFGSDHYKSASWQGYSDKTLRPNIIVLTKQSEQIVRGTCSYPLTILRDILDLTLQNHQ